MENIIDDVCASLEAWRLEEPKHESFCEGIASSALRALNSYINVGNEKALQGAIYLSVAAVGCSTSDHPDRARIVSICHQVFYNKYLLRRDPRDIQCALRLLFEEAKLHSVGDKALLGPYASLSGLYLERFNRWRRDEDLKKAALYGAKAVELFPPDVSNGAYQLYLVALALMQAYESDGSERSLCNAITQMGGAIAASYQVQGRIEFDYMNAYANMLSIRAGRSYGSHHDIEAALYWARKAYEGADATSPLKPTYAQNLSNRYYQRYKRKTKSLWDLDKSIELLRSLPTKELDVGGRASSLALELLDRYRDFGDAPALIEAVRIGRSMVQGSFSEDLINRAKVEHIASLCLEALYGHDHEAGVLEEALRHAGRAATFGPPQKPTGSDFLDTLNRLTRLKEEQEFTRPQNLCENCSHIPHELFEPGSAATCQLFTGEYIFAQLQCSVNSGCHLCALLKDVLDCSPVLNEPKPDAQHTELLLRAADTPSFWGQTWTSPWSYFLTVRLGTQDVGQIRIFNDHESANSAPAKQLPEVRDVVETEIFTPSQISMMNSWLDECMSQHPDCNRLLVNSTDFELPSRLIDIHLIGTNYDVRLVETTGWEANSTNSYAALSHCWGPNPDEIPQTTKENVAARKESIDFNTLSKTFQEAIKVTEALKIRFLWIDSLCIVQHDPDDWGCEASNMHRIYEMAIVTLVASASADGKAGLCRPRDPSHRARLNSCRFSSRSSSKGNTKITIYPHLADWENAVEAGPLSKRGWCFQERQLSRRIIHFTEMRILWECKSSISSEDQKEMRERPVSTDRVMTGTGRLWDTRGGHDVMRAALGANFGMNLAPRQVFVPAKWCQVVEEYSRRRLSYSKDKLPALSGLAHTISEYLGGTDRYLAGSWEGYLARDLSWFPESSSPLPGGERDPLAPSWSWASYPGPVSYHMIERFESEAEPPVPLSPSPTKSWAYSPLKLISAQITPEGIDPFGRVQSGAKLVISSIVVSITISEASYLPHFLPQKPDLKCYSMFKRTGLSGLTITNQLPMTTTYNPRESIKHGVVCFDENPECLDLSEFYCLRLGRGVSRLDRGVEGEGKEMVDMGLVVATVEGGV